VFEDAVDNFGFGILTILKCLLDQIAPQSGWSRRLRDLLSDNAEVPRLPMGYPDGWESCPIWAEKRDGCQAGKRKAGV